MDILELVNITATTATFYLGDGERSAEGYTIELYDSTKTTVVKTAVTDTNGQATFNGLTPETTYYGYYSAAGYVQARTTADEPKTATESQWMDLAERVKSASAGGIKTLTAADYNWPVADPSFLNASLLPAGIYMVSPNETNGLQVMWYSNSEARIITPNGIIIKSGSDAGQASLSYVVALTSGAGLAQGAAGSSVWNTLAPAVWNNFSNNTGVMGSSAGYLLERTVGAHKASASADITELNTADKTSLIAAINELVTRVAALEGN